MNPKKDTQKSAKATTARAEVQDEIRDIRLRRQGEPRWRCHVADCLRPDGIDRRRRGKDRRAREESGEL